MLKASKETGLHANGVKKANLKPSIFRKSKSSLYIQINPVI